MNGLPQRVTYPKFSQTELFDLPIKGFKAMSSLIGSFYNAMSAQVLGGEEMTTNNEEPLCPDVFIPRTGEVVEIKASERSNYFSLSRDQLYRYNKVLLEGVPVYYAFIVYSVGGKRPVFKNLPTKTVKSIIDLLADTTRYMVIFDLKTLNELLLRLIPETGWGEKRYEDTVYVPEEIKGVFNVKMAMICRFGATPLQALAGEGLLLDDHIVSQTLVSNVQVAGVKIKRFPCVRISNKHQDFDDVKLQDIKWVEGHILSAFNDESDLEDEAPF